MKLNKDELYFDGIFVLLITFFQLALIFGGGIISDYIHPILILIFGVFVQYILSFELGYLTKRFEAYNKKWLNNLIAALSFLFIFPMIVFVGVGVLNETGFDESAGWMIMIMLVYIIFGIVRGRNFENRLIKLSEKKQSKRKVTVSSLSAVALAFLNFGFMSLVGNIPTDHSISELIAYFALLIISGFLPFRLMIMFAPPKNKKNMLIASAVILYDVLFLFLT